jgi:VPDSG-CTERM motif
MKTKTASSRLTLLAIAITAALVTQPVFGVAIVNNIVITENSNSSTGLTATYNGSTSGVTVTFVSADHWTITFPSTVNLSPLGVDWVEPENTGLGNAVTAPALNFVNVLSDVTTTFSPVANGTTVMNVGTDFSNGGTINATFNDNGDVAAAPDTGTTASLLGLSLTGLAFFRRKLC